MKFTLLIYTIPIFLVITNLHLSQELIYPDISSSLINDLVFVNDSTGYFINDYGSIYVTNDGGSNWNLQQYFRGNNLTQIEFINETQGFIYSPDSYSGDEISLLYSDVENYNFWSVADMNMGDLITFHPISNSRIIKSDEYGQILLLDNFFEKWNVKYQMPLFFSYDLNIPYGYIVQFHNFDGERILALCNNANAKNDSVLQDSLSFILESLDEGNSWDTLWIGTKYLMNSFAFADDSLGWMVGESSNIYHTSDGGRNWNIQYTDSVSHDYYFNNINVVNSMSIYTLNNNSESIISNDGGNSWKKMQSNLPYGSDHKIEANNKGYAFIYGEDFLSSTNSGIEWERVSKSLNVDFSKIDFVSDKLGWGIGSKGILKTIDGGRNWAIQYAKEDYNGIKYIEMIDSLEGWAILNKKLLHTENSGITWASVSVPSDLLHMRGITFLNKDVGVIFEIRKKTISSVFNSVTTDGGKTWTEYILQAEEAGSHYISSFFKMKFSDKHHLWFVNQQGIWLSNDTAKTWSIIDQDISCYSGFDFYDSLTAMVAIDHETMAFTKDGCKTWTYVENPYSFQTTDIEIIGQTFQGLLTYACGFNGSIIKYYYEYGVFDFVRSVNSPINQTLNDIEVFVKNNRPNIWWAGNGSTVVYRLNEFLTTDINDNNYSSPNSYYLSQNYPNPFNPTTKISYSLPNSGITYLKVYDFLGCEVACLVKEYQSAGKYEIEFNASPLTSGIYFYRLRSGDFEQTKKFVLLK